MPAKPQEIRNTAMSLLALGVVFGDIGTSPLYAYETALALTGPSAAIGVASLVIWTIFLVVTIKYASIIMKADYHGEGGIFALLALLRTSGGKQIAGGVMTPLVVFGAALLLGDGAITPAISVLSAVEGIAVVKPEWSQFALPLTLAILGGLFLAQRFGTGRLGGIFGPLMLLWFLSLAATGGFQVARTPSVLAAFNPLEGLQLLAHGGWGALAIVGAVVLAVTGAEALYADLGHFGVRPILRAWRFVVFPALILNYLGQAAMVTRDPSLASNTNLFFLMVPEGGLRTGMLALATIATIIASQALISAVFSLASQAMDLGFLPRFFVRHMSSKMRGQIYIPLVNVLLGVVCLLLVAVFRTSSSLAGAYGIAVTGAMVVTSIAFGAVMLARGAPARWQALLLLTGLLCLDLPLFIACLTKLFDGGLVPVLIAAGAGSIMLTWARGRRLIRRSLKFGSVTVEELGRKIETDKFARVPGTSVFVVRRPNPEHAVAGILEQYRRVKVLAGQIVILLLDPDWRDREATVGAVKVTKCEGGLWVVRAAHGYMVEPDVPAMMERAVEESRGELRFDAGDSFYVVARELILSCPEKLMPSWQRHLFAFMSRNVVPGPHYLNIPADHLIVYTWLLRL